MATYKPTSVGRLILIAILMTGRFEVCGADEWVSYGPYGGEINQVLVEPGDPQRVYAATDDGLYASSDSGESWQFLEGLGEFTVTRVAIAGRNPGTLFVINRAEDRLLKSDDHGQTWTDADEGLDIVLPLALAVAPSDGNVAAPTSRTEAILYVGGFNASTTAGAVFRSHDSGTTWQPAGTDLEGVIRCLTIDPVDPNVVYAGTLSPVRYLKTTDSGVSWTPLGPSNLDSLRVMQVDPSDPDVIWAGGSGGLEKSVDGGTTWVPVGDLDARIHALLFDPDDPTRIYAATRSDGVYESSDGGTSWLPINEGLTSLSTNSLAFAGNDLYLGSSQGVFLRPEAAPPWLPRYQGLNGTTIGTMTTDPHTPSTVYATSSGIIFKSVDSGSSWQPLDAASPRSVSALAIDPMNPQILYAGSVFDQVYKSLDGGKNWTHSGDDDLPVSVIGALAIDHSDPTTIYAGHRAVTNGTPPTLPISGVYKSIDAATSWFFSSSGMSSPRSIADLVIDPSDPAVLYAADDFGRGIWKSTNRADNWFEIVDGLPSASFKVLAIDPQETTTVYVGTRLSSNGGIFKSLDGGETWFSIRGDLTARDISEIFVIPNDPGTLWVGTEEGLFRNRDAATQWEPFNDGRPHDVISSIAYNSKTDTLYVGTLGGGVYQRSFAVFVDGFESGDTSAWSTN